MGDSWTENSDYVRAQQLQVEVVQVRREAAGRTKWNRVEQNRIEYRIE